jgi:hypothetical protein
LPARVTDHQSGPGQAWSNPAWPTTLTYINIDDYWQVKPIAQDDASQQGP